MKRKLNKKIRFLEMIIVTLFITLLMILTLSWKDKKDVNIISGYYGFDNENMIVSGITAGVSEKEFLQRVYSDCKVSLTDTVKTGAVLSNGYCSYVLAVTGDINGDGIVTTDDLVLLEQYSAGSSEFSDAEFVAADVNGDGIIDTSDISIMKEHIDKDRKIIGCKTSGAEKIDTFYLVTTGQTVQVRDQNDKEIKVKSHNENIVSVDENGTVVGKSPGTAVMTIKSGKEKIKALVTVVNDEVMVELDYSELIMTPGETFEIEPHFTEPIFPTVKWETSDENVATVDENGIINAVNNGEVTITASLENGSRASVQVAVTRLAESMTFGNTAYKCKYGAVKNLKVITEPSDSSEPIVWTSSDTSIATVDENGMVTGIEYGAVTITAMTKYSGISKQCEVTVCDFKQIALTFDDGPSGDTVRLLKFLAEHDLHATFFMIGNVAKYQPETIKIMADGGNELGYHSYDHSWQTSNSLDKVKSDFEKTQQIIYDACGQKATVWRAPGGYYNQEVLDAIKLPHIFWSVDTRDWEPANQHADFVKNAILEGVEDGAIILCHDLYASTVDGAISAISVLLEEGGYEFLTVTELLSRHGQPPQASVTYRRG